ncbi:MAG: carbamoyl phosphate synthase large subunit, partial [Mailhella sp.]|nr:carbamoyl phosphate synthase large subunit [Mailhella sp.]
VEIVLGPEMRSTGEVMGIAATFDEAFLKSQLGAGQALPQSGTVFISVNDRDKEHITPIARGYADLGFDIVATHGTAKLLREAGLEVESVLKVYEGRPNIVDMIKNGKIALVINTASGKLTNDDTNVIRQAALQYGVAYTTTLTGARATARAIQHQQNSALRVECIQDYYSASPKGERA